MKQKLLYYYNKITTFKLLPVTILVTAMCSLSVYAQGDIPQTKDKKSFIGALEFLPKSKLSNGYAAISSTAYNKTDALANPETWFEDGGDKARGMLGDAVLFLEWWTRSTPVERYKFDWTSSGYFEVSYKNDKGVDVFKRINRYELTKYPNLAKRFDNIKPLDVNFEINFRPKDMPTDEYEALKDRHKINSDLGSAGYKFDYTREIDGTSILYKYGGDKTEWTTPGTPIGGWDTFINIPADEQSRKPVILNLFAICRKIHVNSFRITSIKWKVAEIVSIAKKFEAYESGKEDPSVWDQVENGDKEDKAGGDFWDEADAADGDTESFYDNEKRKYGIKTKKGRVLKEGEYDQIVKSKKQKYFIASKGNTVYILNNMGGVVSTKVISKPERSYISLNSCDNGSLTASVETQRENIQNYVLKNVAGESYLFSSGSFVKSNKWFYIDEPLSLTVSSGNESQAEIEENKRQWAIKKKQIIEDTSAKMKASGYTQGGNSICN